MYLLSNRPLLDGKLWGMAPLLAPLASYLEPHRFWIWLQMVAWRLYVRAVKGKGIPVLTIIDRRGTVYLKWIGHPLHEFPQAPDDPLAFTTSIALRIAHGDLSSAHPGERRPSIPLVSSFSSRVTQRAHMATLPVPDT